MRIQTLSNIDDRYFRTSNYYLSAFLLSKGLTLVNIDKTSPKADFVFQDTPERETLVQAYSFANSDSTDCLVDVRKMIFALKQLKERLYDNFF